MGMGIDGQRCIDPGPPPPVEHYRRSVWNSTPQVSLMNYLSLIESDLNQANLIPS